MESSTKKLREIVKEGRDSHFALWNKYVCSIFSIYITKVLLLTRVTPNQVTASMIVFGVVGSIFLFNAKFLIGLILIHFAVLLDNVDGELARARKQRSMVGMYLDGIYHALTTPLMMFGFAFGVYSIHPNMLLIIFGFIAAMFSHSITLATIFDTIISLRIRGVEPPKIESGNGNAVRGYEGHENSNFFVDVFHKAKDLWTFPSNLLLLTALAIWEFINLKMQYVPAYQTTVIFYVLYGTFIVLMQILSFSFHTKKKSVDSFYSYLFQK